MSRPATFSNLLHLLDDSDVRNEIRIALKTTLNAGFNFNHSLCHGDLGNIELLYNAAEILDNSHLHSKANSIAAMILQNIREYGWRCGVEFDIETPGLMNGLAGIGYGLLHLADPKIIPSVLMLEPPQK